MPTPVSVVIICCNAAATIQKTLASAALLTDDVVVVDSGSTDGTISIIKKTGASLIRMEWMGFGANKNKGNAAAKWDWILSLDADEELSAEAIAFIKSLDYSNPQIAYALHRLNYLGATPVKHGEWNNDWTIRLFNRKEVSWDSTPVHEELILSPSIKIKKLRGWLHHYTAKDITVYKEKLYKYAHLMAEKYHANGKKAPLYKIYLSPFFNFFKNYIFQLGLLDGATGWRLGKAHAEYTAKKYKKLKELQSANQK